MRRRGSARAGAVALPSWWTTACFGGAGSATGRFAMLETVREFAAEQLLDA